MKNLFIIAIASILIPSCTPDEMDMVVPQAAERIVVASQLAPDNSLVVVLSKSFTALKNGTPRVQDTVLYADENLIVRNAVVRVTGDGVSQTLFETSPGVYVMDAGGIQNISYLKLDITHAETGLQAASQARFMPEIMFDSVSAVKQNDARYPATITYSITDRPAERNWYVVHYFVKSPQDTVTDRGNLDYIAKRMLAQRNTFDLYTDADFKSGKLCVTKKLLADEISDTIAVALSNISEDYYRFLSAQKRSGLLVNQLRGEVINFPTNISNGYGFFNLHKPDARILFLNN